LLLTLTSMPAKAQFAGFGGGGEDMMTQMAPMLEMLKAKMGKRRFAMMMQTMGPMMSRMMEGGGGIPGRFGADVPTGIGAGYGGGYVPEGYGVSSGGINIGGLGGGELMSMVPQLMRMANVGGARHGRRRTRR
jgi:hypothetical protein